MTTRASGTFTVKETGDGRPYIVFEPDTAEPGFPKGQLGIELGHGTDIEEAQEIAKYLRQKVRGVSFTS
ncbi:hypothetical protein QH301_005789 [Pseudomonas aeruginosa]|nr:hypothetical protein [Pseudomonas aeruginosa]